MLKPIELHYIHEKKWSKSYGNTSKCVTWVDNGKNGVPNKRKDKVPNAITFHSCFALFCKILQEICFCTIISFQTKSNQDSTNGHSQEPINCNDEGDVIGWESDRGQHNHHCDQTSLRDSGRPDTCSSRCDAGLLKRI